MFNLIHKKSHKVTGHAALAFVCTLALCVLLTGVMVFNRSSVEKLRMEQLVLEKSVKINNVITKLLYKTQMLSSVILKNDGTIDDFESAAVIIVDDPAILNILIAPNGVVSEVYPLKGNEAVLNLNFFSEGAGNKEAILAKETGQLVLGGPFDAIQGGQVLVGRLPIFINNSRGEKDFWGIVSVTLKYPQALEGAGLNELAIQDFAYEIWRINPDTGEKQIIAGNNNEYGKNVHYVERQLTIENADWYFRILPVRLWYQFPETWISIIISICLSVLIAYVAQNNHDLKLLQNKLEIQSNTDPLTGIYNRRFFMAQAYRQIERSKHSRGESFMIIFDLDYFKNVNDTYGHQAGDTVLKEISYRVSCSLRPYDIFARYGGEEFIIFAPEISKESVLCMVERLRAEVGTIPIWLDSTNSIVVTASFGVAQASPVNRLETAIALADSALYRAKKEGRDRVEFFQSVCAETEDA